jgi:hypothetical protein
MTTFTSWLKQQSKRDDPIGDLARDYIDAGRLPNSEERMRDHIKRTLVEARSEYDAR